MGPTFVAKKYADSNEFNWEVYDASAFSSKLVSDPGLRLDSKRITMTERKVIRRNIFGMPYRDIQTGEKITSVERIMTLQNSVTRLNDVPVFYMPFLRVDATDPLGPFVGLGLGQDRIFGTQIYTTWDMYKLLALRPLPGHTWRLHLDYLSDRGPAAGTDYSYTIPNYQTASFPNAVLPPSGTGFLRLYGIQDNASQDTVGNSRGVNQDSLPPGFRGRATWQHIQELNDLVDGLYFQGQIAYISDQNFLEQYFRPDWELGPNQETFGHLTWQRGNFGASGLIMPRLARP